MLEKLTAILDGKGLDALVLVPGANFRRVFGKTSTRWNVLSR